MAQLVQHVMESELRAAAKTAADRGGTTNHYPKPGTISTAAFQLSKHMDMAMLLLTERL